jgi:cell division septation protein DedD
MAPRARDGGSRLGTLLFLLGCLVVLGGTFGLGLVVGRHWGRPPAPAAVGEDEALTTRVPDAARGRAGASGGRDRASDGLPALTFYRELTAPLASSPPPAASRPPKASVTKGETADAAAAATLPPRAAGGSVRAAPGRESTPAPLTTNSPVEERFTVQVGAYKDRTSAEALRARLAAAGHEAYIVERDAGGGARYRVRVGSFASRQAATEAAARLHPLAAYVTTR